MSFSGADVDGLDRVAAECRKGAQVCDEVRMVCEAIVAAASFFGPFGAAFIAYLKGVVIPWLKRISEALNLFARVLSAHSAAQRDASSSATSLPSYVTPSLPAGDTGDYPTLPTSTGTASGYAPVTPAGSGAATTPAAASTDNYLFGLISVKHDAAGEVTDVTLSQPGVFSHETTHIHLDRDAAGGVGAISTDSRASALGGLITTHSHASITPQYDSDGSVDGIDAHGTGRLNVGGTTVAQSAEVGTVQLGYGSNPIVPNVKADYGLDVNLDGAPATMPGVAGHNGLPAGVSVPGAPAPAGGVSYQHGEVTIGASAWAGPDVGVGAAASLDAHTDQLSAGLSGGGGTGLSGGYQETGGLSATGQFFGGSYQPGTFTDGTFRPADPSQAWSGALLGGDANAGVSLTAGAAYNDADGGGYVTGSYGFGAGAGAGGYELRHGDELYVGGHGDVAEFGVGAGTHTAVHDDAASGGTSQP